MNIMSATKKCTNCGADNDLFLTNCLFCKSPLPEVNLDSISNEDLIMKAGEWIGKVGSKFINRTENFNEWTGKGQTVMSANIVEGLAQKYLSLLQVRSISNQNLMLVYNDLKNEYDKKRESIIYKIGGGDKTLGFLLVYMGIFMIFLLIVIFKILK